MEVREIEVYAVHRDGTKLYYPTTAAKNQGLPIAAVSIDQNGVTYPSDGIWIRSFGGSIKSGWQLADSSPKLAKVVHEHEGVDAGVDEYSDTDEPVIKQRKRSYRPCVVCGKEFLAKRADAKLCSKKCRHRSSRYGSGQTGTDNCFQPTVTD